MTEIWNLWDVKPPPVCTVKTDLYFKEMSDLSEITYDALKTLRDLDYFNREAAILSRFLYRYRRIFRHDKGIQNLVKVNSKIHNNIVDADKIILISLGAADLKVNQCLKRYLKLNMLEVIFTFKQSIPFNISSVSTHIYFPTRQMLKWVLLRLQAFSQIFVRVIELTKAAGSYIYKKLCLGWSLYNSLFVFCITARILVTSKYLVAKSIEWYSSFYKYLPYLRETSDYLSGYSFPLDLKLWLGEVDLTPIKKTFIDKIFDFINLVKEDEEEDGDDNENLVNEEFIQALFKTINFNTEEMKVGNSEEKTREVKQPLQNALPWEDLGVPVENNEEKAPKKRRRKKIRSRKKTFTDLVLIENDKEEALKEIKKRKRTFTDLVSAADNKEEASKKGKKRKRKEKK